MRVGPLLRHIPVLVGWGAWQLFVVACFFWTSGGAGFAQTPSGLPHHAALVWKLTTSVLRHGWPTDLGRMCVAMKLGPESECKFKQISVSPSEPGAIDYYGFNVPFSTASKVSYVVIYHLGPLVGDFFLVSSEGELKASFYRAKGMDYTEIPSADARRAFDTSMAFWEHNLQALNALISAGKLSKP
jgi:hypothetical protein